MKFEPGMTCTPMFSDGQHTIGHVDEWAARWEGNLSTLNEGDDFEYMDNGAEFEADGLYAVRDGKWERVPDGTKTLYLNGRVRLRHVGPEQLEQVGLMLMVNGREFSEALQSAGTWTDPIDGKIYEWK